MLSFRPWGTRSNPITAGGAWWEEGPQLPPAWQQLCHCSATSLLCHLLIHIYGIHSRKTQRKFFVVVFLFKTKNPQKFPRVRLASQHHTPELAPQEQSNSQYQLGKGKSERSRRRGAFLIQSLSKLVPRATARSPAVSRTLHPSRRSRPSRTGMCPQFLMAFREPRTASCCLPPRAHGRWQQRMGLRGKSSGNRALPWLWCTLLHLRATWGVT